MKKGSLEILILSVLALTLAAPVAHAQTPSAATTPELARQEPANVAELVAKVKRGVVVIQVVDISSPFPVSGSLGSGFVIDKEGHIITNHHVAGSSGVLRVIFWDGYSARATLVATAPGLDIALIRLDDPDPEKLFPVTLGDSAKVKSGELALAMGSPGAAEGFNIDRSNPMEYFGLRSTATMRAITGRNTNLDYQVMMWSYSSLGLDYATKLPYTFLMSAPINPGNSGGPLFNRKGEVIGINTWGWAGANRPLAQHLNGSVPINYAKQFVAETLEKQKWDVPWLGIHVVFPPNIDNTQGYVEFKERYRQPGLHIYGVVEDSPAGRAGLMEGDEIVDVNGRSYELPEEFRADVLEGALGQEYRLHVKRGTKLRTVKLRSVPKPRWIYDFSV